MNKIMIYPVILLVISLQQTFSQTTAPLYNPNADAKAEIKAAVEKASAENKQVLLQIGGNWCPWCIKLNKFFTTNPKADSILQKSYIVVHVNYSKENMNLPLLKELDFPQRFGFPVLVILDRTGKRIHTQDTGLLESGDGYDANKVTGFLANWTVEALDPSKYIK